MRFLLSVLLLLAISSVMQVDAAPATGLAVVCPTASNAGKSVITSGCPAQVHKSPTSSDLVRVDPTRAMGDRANWVDTNLGYVWSPFSSVQVGATYETADCAVEENSSVDAANAAGCTWSFRAKVAVQTPQTFTATPITGPAPLAATLSWNLPGCSSIVASGSWTGTKPVTGTQALTGLTAVGVYTLSCQVVTAPVLGTAVLSWTPPTTNTDGSALTNLAGFKLYRAVGTGAMSLLQQNINPTAITTTDPSLPVGFTYRYQLTAFTSSAESDRSPEVSKVIPATPAPVPWTASVTITPTAPPAPAVPKAPTGFTVQ